MVIRMGFGGPLVPSTVYSFQDPPPNLHEKTPVIIEDN